LEDLRLLFRLKVKFYSNEVVFFVRKDEQSPINAYSFETRSSARKEATLKILNDYMKIVELKGLGTVIVEMDREDYRMIHALLSLDARIEEVNNVFKKLGQGNLSLGEAYNKLLPVIISTELKRNE